MNWKNLFRFTPRAGREEFAAVGLVCNLLTFGNLVLSFWMTTSGAPAAKQAVLQLCMMPVSLLACWAGLALYSRRLHDFDMSLWWYVLYVVITSTFALTSRTGAVTVSLMGVAVWTFLALKKGSALENRFGVTEPFFPKQFGRGAFYLTAALGVLTAASLAAYSTYSARTMENTYRRNFSQTQGF